MRFFLDGRGYDVLVTDLRRRARIKDGKQAGEVQSGERVRDLVGTYYDYTMTIATNRLSPVDYDHLYEAISAPVESHDVIIPYGANGNKSFRAYVEDVSDRLVNMTGSERCWGDLSVSFKAKAPQRYP